MINIFSIEGEIYKLNKLNKLGLLMVSKQEALVIFKKNIHLDKIRRSIENMDSNTDKKDYINKTINELKNYNKILGGFDNESLIKLILLNDNERKAYLKTRLPLITKIKVEESLIWLNNTKKEISKLKELVNDDFKFHCCRQDKLKPLYDQLLRYYIDKSITYELFTAHFYFSSDEQHKLYVKPDKKIRWQTGTLSDLLFLLKGLSNPQKYFTNSNPIKKLIKFPIIMSIKPSIICNVFELENGIPIKESSLYTIKSRKVGKPKDKVERNMREIFEEVCK